MAKVSISQIERAVYNKVAELSEEELEKYGFEKIDKCEAYRIVLGILEIGKRIQPTFYTTYSVKGLGRFVYDIFDGNYPTKVATIKYNFPPGNSKWVDIFIRPHEGYEKTDYVWFRRVGVNADGNIVAPGPFEEFLLKPD